MLTSFRLRMPTVAAPALSLTLPLALALSGCGVFYASGALTPQQTVDKRLVGTPVAAFFAQYGTPAWRSEAKDGTVSYDWQGGLKRVPAGPYGPEESICRLRITSDPGGRIVEAPIFRDGQGEHGLSRCVEVLGGG